MIEQIKQATKLLNKALNDPGTKNTDEWMTVYRIWVELSDLEIKILRQQGKI